jgi:hypothetical protein
VGRVDRYSELKLWYIVQLCGGGYEGFTLNQSNLIDIGTYLTQFLPSTVNENKQFSSRDLIIASTPVVTKLADQLKTHHPAASVPANYKFPSKLLLLMVMDKFIYTNNNFVNYREVEFHSSGLGCGLPNML